MVRSLSLPLLLGVALGAAAALLAPAAASATPSPAGAAAGPPIEVRWLHATPEDSGTRVTGLVRRTRVRPGPVPGFLRLTAPGLAAPACLGWREMRPAGSRGALFSARLPGAIAEATITADYVTTCP
ncbi:MAG: hypothetical protein KGL54_05080 [Sphingomonadales bacterium]|nr:hypothetical protein [Sphingomonadales bacterium]